MPKAVAHTGNRDGRPLDLREEAHIVARSPGGPRAGGLAEKKIDSYENLILLCSEHHKQVDDQPIQFTVGELRQIKQAHKEWVASLGHGEPKPSGQAELVSAWPSVVRCDPANPQSVPRWGAAVRNASELPIYQVGVEFAPIPPSWGMLVVVVEVLPPGEWLVSGRKIYPRPDQVTVGPDLWDMPERTFQIELGFTDTHGQTWHRDRQGLLTHLS